MKKLTLTVTAMLGCSALFAAEPVKQPAEKPAAAPEVSAASAEASGKVEITLDKLLANLPENLAKTDGKVITKKEMIAYMEKQLPGGKLPPVPAHQAQEQISQFQLIAPQLVKQFVDQILLENAAEKAGYKASEEAVIKVLKEQFEQLPAQQKEMVKMQIQIQGKTLDGLIAEQAKNPEIQKGVMLKEFVTREIGNKVDVAENEVKAYYDNHLSDYTEPADPADAVRASHILVKVDAQAAAEERAKAKAKAEEILARVKKAPEKFAEIASKESDCPSKQEGGSLGAFRKGQMVLDFEKAVFAMKPGEISAAPLKTEFGYHIIRRDAPMQARQIPYEQIKSLIMEQLKSEKANAALLNLVSKLEQASKTEFLFTPSVTLPAK